MVAFVSGVGLVRLVCGGIVVDTFAVKSTISCLKRKRNTEQMPTTTEMEMESEKKVLIERCR